MRRVSKFGVATYVRNIVRALARCDSQNQYRLIGPPSRLREFGELPPNFVPVPYALEEASPRDYFHFQNVVRRHACTLVHVPHLFWIPQRMSCPYVITVHDLLEYLYPQPGEPGWKHWAQTYFTRRALARASRIVAVSNSTKSDLVRVFRVPAEKVEVVYNAIDEKFRRGHASAEDKQLVAERYQVNYPFLLYAGNIKAHKNIGRTIEAFAALKAELEKEDRFGDLKLIIIGDELSKHPDLRRTVIKAGVQNDVRFLGFVPIDVLRIFYDLAKIFVFPSLYEGFGLPPLEAMAHGTPVVTSNASSLPEVVGNAAVLVNPENVFEIMRALHRVLLDQPLRERLKARSYEQAQRFSWDIAAAQIQRIYQQASGRHSLSSAAD